MKPDRAVMKLFDRAMKALEDDAMYVFEATDYFGDDLPDGAPDVIAAYSYSYFRGLITEREYHDAVTGATECSSDVFFDFQRFTSAHLRDCRQAAVNEDSDAPAYRGVWSASE